MPANIGGGVQEVMNQAKISNKEDDIILMTKRMTYYGISGLFFFFLPLCVTLHAFQSKPTTKLLNQGSF